MFVSFPTRSPDRDRASPNTPPTALPSEASHRPHGNSNTDPDPSPSSATPQSPNSPPRDASLFGHSTDESVISDIDVCHFCDGCWFVVKLDGRVAEKTLSDLEGRLFAADEFRRKENAVLSKVRRDVAFFDIGNLSPELMAESTKEEEPLTLVNLHRLSPPRPHDVRPHLPDARRRMIWPRDR